MLDTSTIALIAAVAGPGATILCSFIYEEVKARRARNLAATSFQQQEAAASALREEDRFTRAVELAIKSQSDINASLERRDEARNEDFDQMRAFYHDQIEARDRELLAKEREIQRLTGLLEMYESGPRRLTQEGKA